MGTKVNKKRLRMRVVSASCVLCVGVLHGIMIEESV